MSRRTAHLLLLGAALCWPGNAVAQDERPSTAEDLIARQRAELRQVLDGSRDCARDEAQPDTIVVCRQLGDPTRYRDPLPPPVDPGRMEVVGMELPPCEGVCVGFGYVPPWPPMIDMTAFPEPLSAEEAALVSAVAPEGAD